MRALNGFCIALLFTGGLCAQYRSATPYWTGGFGSVVHPGGTPANTPGLTRFQANVVNPGGGGPQLRVPFSRGYGSGNGWGYGRHGKNSSSGFVFGYPYPVYVGGGYGGYSDPGAAGYVDPSAAPFPQQPVGPAGPAGPVSPIIINIGVPGAAAPPPMPQGPPEPAAQQEDNSTPEPTHYLIALKDHTIYSALAYWVEGSTLHYFTSGNVHNQVSLPLVDRELTDRLNRETGAQVNLPR